MTDGYFRAVQLAAVPVGGKVAVVVSGRPILICELNGEFRAVLNRCTHATSELTDGRMRNGTISCPLHGARFDLVTGRCVGGAYLPLTVFQTRVRDEWIEIEIPELKNNGGEEKIAEAEQASSICPNAR